MKMNRRSVLGAIGLVGVGTGAAFGSGAFTSTTAERAVEVNVFGAEFIGDDGLADNLDDEDTNDLGDEIRENFVDVLVDTSDFDTVFFNQEDGQGSQLDAANLFPSSQPENYDPAVNEDYVSLVANDVRIVFGNNDDGEDGDSLPPNSTVNYDDLFAFETAGNFDVTFEGDGEFLTEIGGEPVSDDATFTIDELSADQEDVVVETGAGTENEDLDIMIENND